MIKRFDNLIRSLVTKSSFKTSTRKYNQIKALTSFLDPNFSTKTYITVHDWTLGKNNVSRHPSCTIVILIRKFSQRQIPKPRSYYLLAAWAFKGVRNPIYFRQLTSKCDVSGGPDIYYSQSHLHRTKLYNADAFLPDLHKNDMYCARIFYNVSFPSVRHSSSPLSNSLLFKVQWLDQTIHLLDHCIPQITT